MQKKRYSNGSKFPDKPNEEIITNVPYRQLIGSLNYLAVGNDHKDQTNCFATSYLGRFMEKPSTTAWKAAKLEEHKTTRYCYHSLSRKIKMNRVYNYKPIRYSDADWGFDKLDRKRASGLAVYHCNTVKI